MLAVIFKGIWVRKNRFIFENKFEGPANVIQVAIANLEEFREAQKLKEGLDDKGMSKANVKWSVEGITKINFDAAIDDENQRMRIGLIARNCKGEILFSTYIGKPFIGKI